MGKALGQLFNSLSRSILGIMKVAWLLSLLVTFHPVLGRAIDKELGFSPLLKDTESPTYPPDNVLWPRDDVVYSDDDFEKCGPRVRKVTSDSKSPVRLSPVNLSSSNQVSNHTLRRRTLSWPDPKKNPEGFASWTSGIIIDDEEKHQDIFFPMHLQNGVDENGAPYYEEEDMAIGKGFDFSERDEKFSVGLFGLKGCTVMIIISPQGFYFGHYWESISFDPDEGTTKQPGYLKGDPNPNGFESADDAFEQTVIEGLKNGIAQPDNALDAGTPEQEPLSWHSHLFRTSDAQGFLMGPKTIHKNLKKGQSYTKADEEKYQTHFEDRWAQMKEFVGRKYSPLRAKTRWTMYKYDRVKSKRSKDYAEWDKARARGTALVQYDPDDRYEKDGETWTRKRFVVFMEKEVMADKSWDEKKA